MKLPRLVALTSVALAGAVALTGCGSDNSTGGSGSGSGSIAGAACGSGTLNASGSTAQANAMSAWIKAYQESCSKATINYNASGSGQGVTDFISGQTGFAGSDSALDPTKGEVDKANARCKTGNAVDLPMAGGPIAIVYNVAGLTDLTLTPDVIAKIFSGKITKWNDPAIAAINKGAKLPGAAISTVHRSDSSGTTDNFTKYLTAAAAKDWTFDHDKVWKAPGGQGAAKSDGVAAAVKSTPNTIAYVELSFATQNKLGTAKVDNGGGAVELSPDSASKAIEAATVAGTGDDLTLKLDYTTKESGAYPIVLVTYEITCLKGLKSDQVPFVKSFLSYTSSSDGQGELTQLGYAPLPSSLQTKVAAVVAKIS